VNAPSAMQECLSWGENALTLYDAISTAATNIDMLKRFAAKLVEQTPALN